MFVLCVQLGDRYACTYKYGINNPIPSYLFDVAYRIAVTAALLRGQLCSGRVTGRIYHKSVQISMLACAEQLALAPGAPELLLCIE